MATQRYPLNIKSSLNIVRGSLKIDNNKFAQFLTTDPHSIKVVSGVADDIVKEAKRQVGDSAVAPKGAKYPPLKGSGAPGDPNKRTSYWSATPLAVSKDISVKNVTPKFPRTRRFRLPITVALVVADHPYSLAYQHGGLGIKTTRFMSLAALAVIGRRSYLSKKGTLK